MSFKFISTTKQDQDTSSTLEDLECTVCRGILSEPVTLGCGHSGCRDCYLQIVAAQEAKGKRQAPCPECRFKFAREELKTSKVLDSLIKTLDVKCSLKGCTWEGKLTEAEKHKDVCLKCVVSCPNGCPFTGERGNIEFHLPRCTRGKVECSECQAKVERADIADHGCPFSSLSCPLRCGEDILMCHLPLHMSKCPEKAMECTVPGCKTIMKRKDAKKHVFSYAESHGVHNEREIQRLRLMIEDKNIGTAKNALKEIATTSFRWHFVGTSLSSKPLASPTFAPTTKCRWRAVVRDNRVLQLQLQSAVNPVTAEIRIILMPGKVEEEIHVVPVATYKEGALIADVALAEKDTEYSAKFIITTFLL
ncbi:hypothetical protein ACROYT_G029383 [Oculina patagonica]